MRSAFADADVESSHPVAVSSLATQASFVSATQQPEGFPTLE
jgi:hypothetical protein